MRQKARKRKKTPVSEQQNNNGTEKHPREGNFPPAGVFFCCRKKHAFSLCGAEQSGVLPLLHSGVRQGLLRSLSKAIREHRKYI